MNELCFRKISCEKNTEKAIVVFEQGYFNNPICVLSENEVNDLNKEWKKEAKKK